MIEFRVTHKTLKKSNDVYQAFQKTIGSFSDLDDICYKVAVNGLLGKALVLVEDNLKEVDDDQKQIILKTTLLLVRQLQNSEDVAYVELLIESPNPDYKNDAEAFLYNYATGDINKSRDDGFVKLEKL